MKKLYDLSAKVGEWTNQAGETKGKYRACGALMEGEHGKFILLDKTFNAAGVNNGKDSVMIYLFEPDNNQQAQAPAQAPAMMPKPQQAPQQQAAQANYNPGF